MTARWFLPISTWARVWRWLHRPQMVLRQSNHLVYCRLDGCLLVYCRLVGCLCDVIFTNNIVSCIVLFQVNYRAPSRPDLGLSGASSDSWIYFLTVNLNGSALFGSPFQVTVFPSVEVSILCCPWSMRMYFISYGASLLKHWYTRMLPTGDTNVRDHSDGI